MASAQPPAPQQKIFWGNYDPEKRKADVERKLQQMFDEIRKMDIPGMVLSGQIGRQPGSSRSSNQGKKEVKDIITMQLEEIENEVETLKHEVEAFRQGSCSNKQYDIMAGHCNKLITDLDNLEVCVSGREKLRQRRRQVFTIIQNLEKELGSKIHKEGEYCETGECYKSKN